MAELKPVKNVVIIGAVYSGKDTVLQHLLKQIPDSQHIATGNLLRAGKRDGTLLGKVAEHFDADRSLTPDPYMNSLVEHQFFAMKPGSVAFWVGYPRTTGQLDFLERMFERVNGHMKWEIDFDAVLYLDIANDDTLFERAKGRRSCRPCGLVYHVKFSPPKTADRCDACGGGLYIRQEDVNYDMFANAIREYDKKTWPMVESMRRTYSAAFRPVNAEKDVSSVKADAEKIVKELLKL
ncbi:MAG: nucleoside monophosphate kinase [DPANN group archaeon]|nr:nucleoside monophosphate kinase [DPANN group archaeon]